MAGSEMRMIFDPKTLTATTLLPVSPVMQQSPMFANANGIKMVMELSKVSTSMGNGAATDESVEIKKLGTTEKIAGFDCDDYEITSSKGQSMRACIAQQLGHFLFPQIGSMGRGTGNAPAWTKAFGTKPGFPLKVWSPNGDVAMEVTSVERGSVPASMFEIPEGYIDMSAMMRGRGGL